LPRVIKVSQLKEPERYQALYEAMMNGTEVEGGYVMQYTEYPEDGQTVAKFTLRERELKSSGEGATLNVLNRGQIRRS